MTQRSLSTGRHAKDFRQVARDRRARMSKIGHHHTDRDDTATTQRTDLIVTIQSRHPLVEAVQSATCLRALEVAVKAHYRDLVANWRKAGKPIDVFDVRMINLSLESLEMLRQAS